MSLERCKSFEKYNRQLRGNTFNPALNYENSPIMDVDDRIPKEKETEAKQRRQKEIEEKWARKNEESLIKQLEEQNIMNLRYKVAKERLEKRSKRGAAAAESKRPSFQTNESVSSDGMIGNYHPGVSFGDTLQWTQGKRNRTNENRIKTMKIGILWAKIEFLEPTSLADLPPSLFMAESPPTFRAEKRAREGREIIFEGV